MKIKNVLILLSMFAFGALVATGAFYVAQKSMQKVLIEAVNKNTTEIVNEFDKIKSKNSDVQLELNSEARTGVWPFKKKVKKDTLEE